jgi:hypothetical protein
VTLIFERRVLHRPDKDQSTQNWDEAFYEVVDRSPADRSPAGSPKIILQFFVNSDIRDSSFIFVELILIEA